MRDQKDIVDLLATVCKQYAQLRAKPQGNAQYEANIQICLTGLDIQINTLEWVLGVENKLLEEQKSNFKGEDNESL